MFLLRGCFYTAFTNSKHNNRDIFFLNTDSSFIFLRKYKHNAFLKFFCRFGFVIANHLSAISLFLKIYKFRLFFSRKPYAYHVVTHVGFKQRRPNLVPYSGIGRCTATMPSHDDDVKFREWQKEPARPGGVVLSPCGRVWWRPTNGDRLDGLITRTRRTTTIRGARHN